MQAKMYEMPQITEFKLRPVQEKMKEIIETTEGKNILVVGPTGIGKTLMGRMGIHRAVDQGFRAVWGSPLKADTKEKYLKFREIFETFLDSGDNRTDVKKYEKKDWDVSVMTYERMNSIIRSAKKRSIVFEGFTTDPDADVRPVDCVVIDEIHNIESINRGPNLEATINAIRELYPEITIIGLSATIGNPESFAKWFDAILIQADESERPVPLEKFVWTYKDQKYHLENIKLANEIVDDIIIDQYPNDSFFVFCSARYKCEDLAKFYCGTKKKPTIAQMIQHGYAYHHAGLKSKPREKIEQAFRKGKVRVIFCTPTLAQGVDFNVDQTIVKDTHRYSYLRAESVLISHNEFIQMGGRAGRPGYTQIGRFHTICTDEYLGPVIMRMDESMIVTSQVWRVLTDYILQNIVNGIVDNYESAVNYCKKIFNYEVEPEDEEYISEEKINGALNWLIEKEFLKELSMGQLEPTKKGKLTSWLMVSVFTAQHWIDSQEVIKNFNKPEHIFAILLDCEEFLNNITVRYTSDQQLLNYGEKWLKMVECFDCNAVLPFERSPKCPRCGNDKHFRFKVRIPDQRMLKAFSMTFRTQILKVINEFITNPKQKKKIKMSPTDEYLLKKEVNRLMSACVAILRDCPDIKMVESTALLANAGILDPRVLELLEVEGIGMTYAARLVNSKILTVADFLQTEPSYLQRILSSPAKNISMKTVEKLVQAAKEWYANE